MLIKEQNNSHQSSLLTGPVGFLSRSKIIVSVVFTRKISVVLTIENVCFLNEQLLIELCHDFSLNLVNLYLSVSKERIVIHQLQSIDLNLKIFLRFNALSYGYLALILLDITIFLFLGIGQISRFLSSFFSDYHIIDSSHFTFYIIVVQKGTIEHIKVLKGMF